MGYKPGQSGNPKGRPPQTFRASKVRQTILKEAPAFVAALIEAAKQGDVMAGRSLLHCVVPPLKPADMPEPLPIPQGGDLAAKAGAILDAAGAGKLPVNQAAALLGGLAAIARLRDVDEFDSRLRAIEERLNGPR